MTEKADTRRDTLVTAAVDDLSIVLVFLLDSGPSAVFKGDSIVGVEKEGVVVLRSR